MPLPTRQTVLSAVLGVALSTGTPVPAQEPMPPAAGKTEATSDQIESLKKELAVVKNLLESLDLTIYGRKDGVVVVPQDKGHRRLIEDLTNSMKEMDKRIKALEEKLAKTTASSSPLATPPATVPPATVPIGGKGTLKLVNEYSVPVSLVVNGVSHSIDPRQSKELEVPAGNFTYELLGTADAKKTSTIKENETVTLRIR